MDCNFYRLKITNFTVDKDYPLSNICFKFLKKIIDTIANIWMTHQILNRF